MKFEDFARLVADTPVIETATFRAFWPSIAQASVAIARWTRAGKLIQLRRGKYVLAADHARRPLSLGRVANLLVEPSYLSLEWALSFHGLIPEAVYGLTSVTTRRPVELDTPVGRFRYRHVARSYFWGYDAVDEEGQAVLVARPEKALIDLFHLTPGPFPRERLEGYRFQNVSVVSRARLGEYAALTGSPKLVAVARQLVELFEDLEREE